MGSVLLPSLASYLLLRSPQSLNTGNYKISNSQAIKSTSKSITSPKPYLSFVLISSRNDVIFIKYKNNKDRTRPLSHFIRQQIKLREEENILSASSGSESDV